MPQTPHLLQPLEKTFPNTSSYGRDPWFSEERSNLGIILRMLSIIQHWSPHPTNVVPNCRTSSPNRKSRAPFRDLSPHPTNFVLLSRFLSVTGKRCACSADFARENPFVPRHSRSLSSHVKMNSQIANGSSRICGAGPKMSICVPKRQILSIQS